MCTDLRLVRLNGLHISGRTMDFAQGLSSRVQVVPAGNSWSATETGAAVRPWASRTRRRRARRCRCRPPEPRRRREGVRSHRSEDESLVQRPQASLDRLGVVEHARA